MAHSPRRAAREGPAGQVGTQAEPTPIRAGSRTLAPASTSARGSVEAFQLVSHMGNGTRPSSWAFVTCQLVARPPSPTPESPAPRAPRDRISGIRDSGLAGGWGGPGERGRSRCPAPSPLHPTRLLGKAPRAWMAIPACRVWGQGPREGVLRARLSGPARLPDPRRRVGVPRGLLGPTCQRAAREGPLTM